MSYKCPQRREPLEKVKSAPLDPTRNAAVLVQVRLDVINPKTNRLPDFVIRNETALHPIVNRPGLHLTILSAFSFCQKTLHPSFFRWMSLHFVCQIVHARIQPSFGCGEMVCANSG